MTDVNLLEFPPMTPPPENLPIEIATSQPGPSWRRKLLAIGAICAAGTGVLPSTPPNQEQMDTRESACVVDSTPNTTDSIEEARQAVASMKFVVDKPGYDHIKTIIDTATDGSQIDEAVTDYLKPAKITYNSNTLPKVKFGRVNLPRLVSGMRFDSVSTDSRKQDALAFLRTLSREPLEIPRTLGGMHSYSLHNYSDRLRHDAGGSAWIDYTNGDNVVRADKPEVIHGFFDGFLYQKCVGNSLHTPNLDTGSDSFIRRRQRKLVPNIDKYMQYQSYINDRDFPGDIAKADNFTQECFGDITGKLMPVISYRSPDYTKTLTEVEAHPTTIAVTNQPSVSFRFGMLSTSTESNAQLDWDIERSVHELVQPPAGQDGYVRRVTSELHYRHFGMRAVICKEFSYDTSDN